MESNSHDVNMVQHIPIRFGKSATDAADRDPDSLGSSASGAADQDPDSLASSDRYTREGLLEHSQTGQRAKRAKGEQPEQATEEGAAEAPSAEEVAKLRAQLDAAQRQCHGIARDLENYKRHTKKELATARQDAESGLLAELGDVVRSLELAMESVDQDADAVRQGVQMVARRLGKVYEDHGVERIPTVGHPFDPALHEAVLMESSSEADKGTILKELSPGYTFEEKVIRPAKVSVAD